MQHIEDFTFRVEDELFSLEEEEWNLNDCDSKEGSSANSPKEIESIAKNMNDIEVSKKISKWYRSQMNINTKEVSSISVNWIQLKDLKYDKNIVKSTSKNYKIDRKLLSDEIRELHSVGVNLNKKDWIFNSNFRNYASNHILILNKADDKNVERYNDDLITMKQIPALN